MFCFWALQKTFVLFNDHYLLNCVAKTIFQPFCKITWNWYKKKYILNQEENMVLRRNNFMTGNKTNGSIFILFLMKTCFLPIQFQDGISKKLSIWSKTFWIHITIFIVPFFFANFYVLYQLTTANVVGQLVSKYSFVETLTVFSTYVSHFSAFLLLIIG